MEKELEARVNANSLRFDVAELLDTVEARIEFLQGEQTTNHSGQQ